MNLQPHQVPPQVPPQVPHQVLVFHIWRNTGALDKPCGEDARMLTKKLSLNDT